MYRDYAAARSSSNRMKYGGGQSKWMKRQIKFLSFAFEFEHVGSEQRLMELHFPITSLHSAEKW